MTPRRKPVRLSLLTAVLLAAGPEPAAAQAPPDSIASIVGPETDATVAGDSSSAPGTLVAGGTASVRVPGAGIPSVDTLAPPARRSVDHRAFHYVYYSEGPAFSGTMREINAASRPIFLAAVPASGLVALAAGADLDPTARLAASQLGVGAVVFGMKFLVRRPRPYVALPDIKSRVAVPLREHDPYSLPSGHAAISFAMATSTSLSYPRWYVIAPAYAWASTTALARVWHGVHFPSDILLGAAIGTGVATVVHLFMPELDPDDDAAALGRAPPPAVSVRIPF
jgi:membrane-associated phospholipid phosphatase